jgi:hypothetical protein
MQNAATAMPPKRNGRDARRTGCACRLENDVLLPPVKTRRMTGGGTYASPPCMAAEVDPAYFDPLGVDPEQARDVARWRRAERIRLAGLREGLGQAGRAQVSGRIGEHLGRVLAERRVGQGTVLSGYWPIKGRTRPAPASDGTCTAPASPSRCPLWKRARRRWSFGAGRPGPRWCAATGTFPFRHPKPMC